MPRHTAHSLLNALYLASAFAMFGFVPRVVAQVEEHSISAVNNSISNAEEGATAGGGQYGQNPGSGSTFDQSRWSHLAFEGGFGLTSPSQGPITYGYNLTVGAGWKFTPKFATMVEYQFNRNKIPGAVLSEVGAPGGNVNTWSFTVDPIFNYWQRGRWGAYVTGGGGFYRKVTNYTAPVAQQYCDYFYGYCGVGYQNTTIGHFSSNQGGLNIGGGFTWSAFGADSREKLYAEARYVWVDSPGSSPSNPGTGTEALVPLTFGIRF